MVVPASADVWFEFLHLQRLKQMVGTKLAVLALGSLACMSLGLACISS